MELVEKISSECFLSMVMSNKGRYEHTSIKIRNSMKFTSITSTSLSSGMGINDDNGNSLV